MWPHHSQLHPVTPGLPEPPGLPPHSAQAGDTGQKPPSGEVIIDVHLAINLSVLPCEALRLLLALQLKAPDARPLRL